MHSDMELRQQYSIDYYWRAPLNITSILSRIAVSYRTGKDVSVVVFGVHAVVLLRIRNCSRMCHDHLRIILEQPHI